MRVKKSNLTVATFLFILSTINNAWAEQESNIIVQKREAVVALVEKAKDFIQTNGKEKAIAEFNKKYGEFSYNSNYVAIVDYDGTFQANINWPALIGTNQINFQSPSGVFVVQEEIEKAKAGGGWIENPRFSKNPQTDNHECKKIYVLPMEGDYLIASGYYYNTNNQGNC